MSDNENKPPTQEPSSSEGTENKNFMASGNEGQYWANGQYPNSPSNSGTLGCLGFLGGVVYLIIIFFCYAKLDEWIYRMKGMGFSFNIYILLALLGHLLVFYYAKKNNKRALFWGFITPYLLLLLLFGSCMNKGWH